MPVYNFKKQFAADVESGKKHQTIRKPRKRPTVAGDTLFLYTGMRTKSCRKLLERTCTAVNPFIIYVNEDVFVGERLLHPIDLHHLAVADGFESSGGFIQFFLDQYGLPFHGELIEW